AYESRKQNLSQSMSLTVTLLKIHDVSAGAITPEQLDATVSKAAVVHSGSGECLKWVIRAVEVLHSEGLVDLGSADNLAQGFSTFAAGNRSYATRNKFPNVKASQ
ncbi:hypothetical protein EV702DRAFT_950393, partial [Suillus placidus]